MTRCVIYQGTELGMENETAELQWVADVSNYGYVVVPKVDDFFQFGKLSFQLKYTFFEISSFTKLHQLSEDQFQNISRIQNDVLLHSVYEEAYHRILAKCHDVLSKIKKEKENLSCKMKGLIFKYLYSGHHQIGKTVPALV
jgi:tRNA G10  N-methylase Trm11